MNGREILKNAKIGDIFWYRDEESAIVIKVSYSFDDVFLVNVKKHDLDMSLYGSIYDSQLMDGSNNPITVRKATDSEKRKLIPYIKSWFIKSNLEKVMPDFNSNPEEKCKIYQRNI